MKNIIQNTGNELLIGVFVGGRKRKKDDKNARNLCLKEMKNNYYII